MTTIRHKFAFWRGNDLGVPQKHTKIYYNQNGKTSSPDLQWFILKFFIISLKVNTVFFNDLVKNHKITKNRFWSLIASLVSSIFHKLYGCYSRFASFHSYWIFQILFLFWSNSQLLDRIPAVFHSGLNSRFFLQVFLLSMTDDRIPLVYYNKYQRNEAKSNIL